MIHVRSESILPSNSECLHPSIWKRIESASYPKQIPIRLPCTIRSWFSLTSFNLPATSFRGMEPISAPCRETIRPNCPEAISSVACPPIRVARLRSYGVGEPPRWIYPSTVSRVSNPVSYSISWAIYSAAFCRPWF